MVEIQANFIVNPNFLMAIVDKSEIIVICVVILIIIAINRWRNECNWDINK